MTEIAGAAARSVRRGLRVARVRAGARRAARDRVRRGTAHTLGRPASPDVGAAAAEPTLAELDALRGELVRELDRLAAGDGSSAAFRRL